MTDWYTWDSLESFNEWHLAKMAELGLPKLSVDAEGNTIADSVETTAITIVEKIADNDYRAQVEDNNAEGLTLSTKPERL
jgi:hypothetical protein